MLRNGCIIKSRSKETSGKVSDLASIQATSWLVIAENQNIHWIITFILLTCNMSKNICRKLHRSLKAPSIPIQTETMPGSHPAIIIKIVPEN